MDKPNILGDIDITAPLISFGIDESQNLKVFLSEDALDSPQFPVLLFFLCEPNINKQPIMAALAKEILGNPILEEKSEKVMSSYKEMQAAHYVLKPMFDPLEISKN